ncbi:MAG: hypothetical protein MUF13_03770 [Akkermansiaceae bacterium]|nr:hypothetical protein [Akkermansiaceae bacterium]
MSAALGDEVKPKAVEVIEELTRAYAKLDGFKATYQSVGKGKTLDCTLGLDENSRLAASQVVVRKGDQKMVQRLWNTSHDQMFFAGGDDLIVFKGTNAELKSLTDLMNLLATEPDADGKEGTYQSIPSILLEKTVFAAGFGLQKRDQPSWADIVEDAPIKDSDEKTVTFSTDKYGLLTISRENGMLIRQSVTADDGEVRVLELKELQVNPGKDSVERISTGWSTIGAKELPLVSRMAPLRLVSFQLIIDSVENGQAEVRVLDDLLESQYESLRHFARACIDMEGPFATKANWPGLFDKVKTRLHLKWLQDVPGADAADKEGFLKYQQEPEIRLEVRNSLVAGMMEMEKLPEVITDEIFGRGGWASLKVGNDRGVAAKQSLVKALTRAYLEELVDQKMTKQWDQRDGLD